MPVRVYWQIVVKDHLKPLAQAWQKISAVLGIKKRRKVAPSARDDQLRVKVPVLVDSEQSVSDLAFFQERPANPPWRPWHSTAFPPPFSVRRSLTN